MSKVSNVSVILPSKSGLKAYDNLSKQLGRGDELLVVCDDESDPIAEHVTDDLSRTKLIVSGPPENCSGKANAIANGMKSANNDVIVWTDDDFHHPSGWLDQMKTDYKEKGPVSELPFFKGGNALSVLAEPVITLAAPLGQYLTNSPWGGSVIFGKDELELDDFLSELQQTISDDGLLSEYLSFTTVNRVRVVETESDIRLTANRLVRFIKTANNHVFGGTVSLISISLILTLFALLFPVYAFPIMTILSVLIYYYFNINRWTAALIYPSVIFVLPFVLYAVLKRTFVWGGRRYRWVSKLEVEVEEV